MWVAVSASVTILTYGFLFQSTIRTTIGKSPQFFLNLNLRRMSAGAIRWSRILASEVLPLMLMVVVIFGATAGMGVGLWKLYTSNLSKGAKAGITVGIAIVNNVLILLWFRYRRAEVELRRTDFELRGRGTL